MNEISMAYKIIMTVITLLGLAQIPCLAFEKSQVQQTITTKEERTVCFDEEAIAEASDQLTPGYILGMVDLENRDKVNYPSARFVIIYGPIEGSADLLSLDFKHSPKPEEQTNLRRLVEFTNRVSFYKEGPGWQKLSLESAKKIFGEPHLRGVGKTTFYVFDTYVTFQREKQLFHIDMKFAQDGTIESYRIRGIGIRNPQWVSKDLS
ncbi:MAG: hypothetical protein QG574_731 [Cyanobacteriota bacterium erpe_2018_sw_21hr_WHONDRS-SW48-000092_B_bin.40]|nr:hypothetical protein [Cyanobacteriota bacterium erpe_2018_sw_21hr_WHONDRS-SW48-000092_B_bin.40]